MNLNWILILVSTTRILHFCAKPIKQVSNTSKNNNKHPFYIKQWVYTQMLIANRSKLIRKQTSFSNTLHIPVCLYMYIAIKKLRMNWAALQSLCLVSQLFCISAMLSILRSVLIIDMTRKLSN